MRAAAVGALMLLLSAGCGGGSEPSLPDAVAAYSTAYVGNDVDAVFGMWSERCATPQNRETLAYVMDVAQGHVVRVLSEDGAGWTLEHGRWVRDDC